MNSVLDNLKARGFIAQTSDEKLGEYLARGPATIYVGFDPTASSLHLGHLVPIMALAHLQRTGHRALVIVGGATGMIGDPSGQSEERNLLTTDQIAENIAGVRQQLASFLDFDGDNAAVMLDNNEWIGQMSFIDWLRDVGKYFTINYMVAKESIKNRMGSEQGISFTEFSYITMQAYDFLHLHDAYGCTVQAGGNDQWGNITAGIDLIRKVRNAKAYGMTFPLLMTAGGQKFGKTAGNAVWLAADRTSPYHFYQYWVRTDDADVECFLKLFSFLELDEIERIMGEHNAAPHDRGAQKALAEQTTLIVHGKEGLAKAVRASEALFGGDLAEFTAAELQEIFADVPSSHLAPSRIDEGLKVVDLLVETGLVGSKGEARRKIAQGGAYINNERVAAADAQVGAGQVLGASIIVLRLGKKQYHLVQLT